MKKNIKKILSFALMLSLLVGMMAGFSVFAAEEETPAVEIVSKNVYYADTLKLMYAVRTDDADVVLNIYDENNNLLETITKHESQAVNGMDVEVFISSFGVPAQDIDTVFYAEAVLSDGTKSAKVRYSVLEYLYERLTVSADVSAEQKLMYNNLLAFADSADIVVNKTAADKSIANYAYVRVNNGTVDGAYSAAMLMAGTKLDALTTTLVPGTNMVLAWNVSVNDLENVPSADLVTSEAVADMTVEAGKAYILTATEIDSGVTFVDVTTSMNVGDYAAANEWKNETVYLNMDINALVTATASLDPTASYKNTGKYYTNGNNWRFYQNETATLTISAEGNNIVSVKVTYTVANTGVLTLNGTNVTSGTVVNVNASSVTFAVGSTGTNDDGTPVTNGNVRISAIEVVYQVPAHDCVYSEATCTAPAICSICGAVNGDKLPHSYDAGVANPEATCTTAGLMVYTCSCGDKYTEVIEALGHTVETGTCGRCGEEVGGANTPAENTESLNIYANQGTSGNKSLSWTQGDVTVSNEQASSSNAIVNTYTDHARLYAKSDFTVAVNGGAINKIVVTCTSSSYATALKNSCEAAGLTVSVNGSVVTITVLSVESITVSMTAQTRIKKVEVTYMK